MIKFYISVLLLFSLNAHASESELDVDFFYLQYIIKSVRNYSPEQSKCQYTSDDAQLLNEFLSASNKGVNTAKYSSADKNEINLFVPIPKKNRPGLYLTIQLNGNQCESFALGEIMN